MLNGIELFVGAKREDNLGHIIMVGMGGIYLETIKDINSSLSPISDKEADYLIKALKSYPILRGSRGNKGINVELFKKTIVRLSDLLDNFPSISELDINPLIASKNEIFAVDCRIKIDY